MFIQKTSVSKFLPLRPVSSPSLDLLSQTSRLGSRFKANCFTVFSASLSFCFDICWPCKLVQNILWTNCKLSKYMFKGKQAKSSLSSNLCVKLISQKSKKVKLYQVPRHRQQTSKHSCGEGRSTQLRITSTLEGNTNFYSGEKYFMSEGKRSTDRYTQSSTLMQIATLLDPWAGLSLLFLWPPDL